MLGFFNKSRLKYVEDSCRHLEGFCTRQTLQLFGVIWVAGEEENLVVFGEGSDGLDGGGAAVDFHVGEWLVEEEELISGR